MSQTSRVGSAVGVVVVCLMLASGCLAVGSTVDIPVATGRANDVNASGLVVGSRWPISPPALVDNAYAYDLATSTYTGLGTLGGSASVANAVNDAGTIVGWSTTADFKQHAFSYTSATGMVDLGTLDPPGTGAAAQAEDINSSGVIVGTSITHAHGGNNHAFVRNPTTGAMTDLGTLGGTSSGATAINDAGVIVGWSQITGDAETHAFALEPGGTMIDLGTLGGNESRAEDLDEAGLVVGWSKTLGDSCAPIDPGLSCPQYRAFTFDLDTGVRTELDTIIGTTDARAYGINEAGVIVGQTTTTEVRCSGCPTRTNAVAWEAGTSGVYKVGDNDYSGLTAINDGGTAVGTVGDPGPGPFPMLIPSPVHAQVQPAAG